MIFLNLFCGIFSSVVAYTCYTKSLENKKVAEQKANLPYPYPSAKPLMYMNILLASANFTYFLIRLFV